MIFVFESMYQCVPGINQSFTSDVRDVKSNGGDWDFGVLSPPPIFVSGLTAALILVRLGCCGAGLKVMVVDWIWAVL
jgi:hypothetical protein